MWISGLVSLYVGSSNRYFMKEFSTLEDIGLYSLAERLSAVIGLLIFTPFFNYWSAERFRLQDRPDFDEIHRQVFKVLYVILLSLGCGLVVYGDFIVGILTDSRYHGATAALPFLIVAHTFYDLTQFYQYSFLSTEKTMVMSKIMNISAVVATISNYFLIIEFGFIGAAGALAISYFVMLMCSYQYAKSFYDMRLPIYRFFISMALCGMGVFIIFEMGIDLFTVLGFMEVTLYYILILLLLFVVNFDRKGMPLLMQKLKS